MVPCEDCHKEFRRRINRRNQGNSTTISVADVDDYFNEAEKVWHKIMTGTAEVDSAARNSLRQLEVKNKKLKIKCNKDFYVADFPSNYYSTLNYRIYASKEGCEDCPKTLIPRTVQSDKLEESLKDSNRQPSFEYEEVLVDEAGNSLVIYTNNEFNITDVLLSYYRKITPIACPSLTLDGYYINGSGKKIDKDVHFEIDSTYDKDDIIDIAVLYYLRDVSDSIEMDSQLMKINSKYKIFQN